MLNTCKLNEKFPHDFFGMIMEMESSERASNAWVTNLKQGDNIGKPVLIPHICRHGIMIAGKALRSRFETDPRPIS